VRSIKEISKKYFNDKLYGEKFRFYRDNISLDIYTITSIPTEYVDHPHISNKNHCWIEWEGDGIPCNWDVCRRNIKNGIWILL
jgi:hypothetical protein